MKHHVSGIAGLAAIAMVGGAVLLLQAIVAVATSTPDSFTGTTSGYFSDGLSAAGLVLTIAGLIALRLVRATGDGRVGVTAIVLACVGQLGLVVSITSEAHRARGNGPKATLLEAGKQALWRTRTADPLLTMEVLYQLS